MKISNREKSMLVVLLMLIIGVGYYNFVYVDHVAKLDELKAQEQELKIKKEAVETAIANMEVNSASVAMLQEQIAAESESLYPDILQEKIILELNKLIDDSGITANISFTEVTTAPIESYFTNSGEEESTSSSSSLEEMAEDIREKNELGEVLESNKELGEEQEAERDGEEVQEEEDTVTQMKVSVAFTGTYDNTLRFIKAISEYERLIAVPNISIASSGEEEVSGAVDLEFYSVPKLSGTDEEYLKWALNNKYGKGNPFTGGSSSVTIPEEEKNNSAYNMLVVLKENISDLPSVTMGISESDMTETHLSDDTNGIHNINMEITEADGKYYVKYMLGDKNYPKDFNSMGYELTNINGTINIGIKSCLRSSMDDKVAINFNIENSTSKRAVITIMDDDQNAPRVNIAPKGNVQYVNK